MATAGIQQSKPGDVPVIRTPELIGGPFREIEFAEQLKDLWQGHGWQAGRTSKTLAKYSGLRIVLTALNAHAYVHEHHAAGSISVQTIEGHLRMHIPGRTFDLKPGEMVVLEAAIPHDVEALKDSSYLLTVSWHDAALEHNNE
jgi:quercetin dioxygenase-like cupin family protein